MTIDLNEIHAGQMWHQSGDKDFYGGGVGNEEDLDNGSVVNNLGTEGVESAIFFEASGVAWFGKTGRYTRSSCWKSFSTYHPHHSTGDEFSFEKAHSSRSPSKFYF